MQGKRCHQAHASLHAIPLNYKGRALYDDGDYAHKVKHQASIIPNTPKSRQAVCVIKVMQEEVTTQANTCVPREFDKDGRTGRTQFEVAKSNWFVGATQSAALVIDVDMTPFTCKDHYGLTRVNPTANTRRVTRLAQQVREKTCAMRCLLLDQRTGDARLAFCREKSLC